MNAVLEAIKQLSVDTLGGQLQQNSAMPNNLLPSGGVKLRRD
ncbi:MAG: hypothetical protein ACRC4N_16240 [Gammaproteobacteria bacterium]